MTLWRSHAQFGRSWEPHSSRPSLPSGLLMLHAPKVMAFIFSEVASVDELAGFSVRNKMVCC